MRSSQPTTGSTRTKATAPQRPSVVVPAVIVALLLVGGAVAYKMMQGQPAPTPPATAAAPENSAPPAESHPAIRPIVPREEVSAAPSAPAPVQAVPGTAVAPVVEPAVPPQNLLASLKALDIKGPISAEDAAQWKKNLRQLVTQGASSIPTIQEYLAAHDDVNYTGVQGSEFLGYSSLRAGLIDALGQIGGPDGTQAMLQVLQSTTYPTDIAALASSLEQQAPGQYQSQILSAVRSQLSQASQDQLGNANVAPLFQVLANAAANGTDVSADLTQYSGKWPYYASIELANLPNGAGVPSLIQIATTDNGPGQAAATQELAQLAPQNKTAADAIINLINQGTLADSTVAGLASYLTGRQNELGPTENPPGGSSQALHIANGNQDFTSFDGLNTLTPDQAAQRISLIDQLLQNLPATDTQAQNALQQAKISLSTRAAR